MSIKDYLIKELQDIEEIKAISNAIDPEINELNEKISVMIDDQFIETATEKGIARREKILKIQPYSNDTLETRRFRVGVKWDNQLPYTYKQLESKLSKLVGPDGYTTVLNHNEYILIVKISLGVKRMLQDADKMIRNMSPQNLIVTVGLLYNKHSYLATFTHAQLAAYTHIQLREEVL